MRNAFSVDVEDYFHVSAFENHIPRNHWHEQECRVVSATQRLLALLEKHQVRATFFVLGWVAHRFPELIQQIFQAGHEIGSHSYWHRLVYTMSPEEFRQDLKLSCDVIAQITGQPVRLYRAPSFSITKKSLWALDILAEEGITIDSSIFPVVHDRYGMPDAPLHVHRRATRAGTIIEFPMAVALIGPWKIPISGGGYFRLYPTALSIAALRRVNVRQHQPFCFYIHPWEIDPDQPRLHAGSVLTRLRHYLNLRHTEEKLARLLRAFTFDTVTRVVEEHLGPAAANS
jgi:polysaccharide deacetylase family protein (PEP-CTERM system associated)